MKLPEETVSTRMAFARSVGFDEYLCSAEWHIERPAVRNFIRQHQVTDKRQKPEWEYGWVNDLQVLTREEYMVRYGLNEETYASLLTKARREHGEIATPEQREMWDRQYWEGL
jgi:hypothetical protein